MCLSSYTTTTTTNTTTTTTTNTTTTATKTTTTLTRCVDRGREGEGKRGQRGLTWWYLPPPPPYETPTENSHSVPVVSLAISPIS